MRTRLLYQHDTYLFNAMAQVLSFKRLEGGKALLILDQTIFYPQGGGQPSDVGDIKAKASGATMKVSMVRTNPETKQVEHEGILTENSPDFIKDEEVELDVNREVRLLHSRIHSAGHLLDHGVQLLGFPMEGTKGFHFPSGPYVEYKSTSPDLDLSPSSLEAKKQLLEQKCRQMIEENRRISVISSKPQDLSMEILISLPEKARQSEIVRLVEFEGAPMPLPCGGTHVASSAEIGTFSIKKISAKGEIIRVGYIVA
jgi:Ser-tRNA(Ala) deacylase AlaX